MKLDYSEPGQQKKKRSATTNKFWYPDYFEQVSSRKISWLERSICVQWTELVTCTCFSLASTNFITSKFARRFQLLSMSCKDTLTLAGDQSAVEELKKCDSALAACFYIAWPIKKKMEVWTVPEIYFQFSSQGHVLIFYTFFLGIYFGVSKNTMYLRSDGVSKIRRAPMVWATERISSMVCYTLDCHVHLSRFSLTMNMRVLVHFMGTANHGYNEQVLTTMGVRYNQVWPY